jgi:hypothetical protein
MPTDQIVAGWSARDRRGMSAPPTAVATASALVRGCALVKAVMACKTVGYAHVGVRTQHLSDFP